jgi:nifR3 family TIM-barrel protein
MQIGTLHLPNNLILAPMAGISDLPYRRLMKRFGAGLVFTEMVSANGLIRAGQRTRELLRSHPEERPLGVQLFGDDPAVLATAAGLFHDDGDMLDLNMGCPVNKVIRSGAGSALLREPARIGQIVAAVRRAWDKPLTVKIRSGWDAPGINYLEIGRIAQEEGAEAITLHPRTRSQGFSGQADWEHIRLLKAALQIPVIGSGDIFAAEDALAMLTSTSCDGIMIGRGGYGNPWLFRQILALQKGEAKPAPPTAADRHQAALLHLELFLETFPARKALLDMRKHLCWYSRGITGAAAFRTQVNQLESLEQMRQLLADFFAAGQAAEEVA